MSEPTREQVDNAIRDAFAIVFDLMNEITGGGIDRTRMERLRDAIRDDVRRIDDKDGGRDE